MSKSRLFFACLSVLLLGSCASNGGKDEVSYLPVKLERKGGWSMLGPDGKLLFQDGFEEAPTPVVNGVFVVPEGETYSIYRAAKKPKLVADGLKNVGVMNSGLIPTVKDGGRITLMDKNGKEKFVLDSYKGAAIVTCASQYSEGLLEVWTTDGKWGYVDTKGEMAIAPKYDVVNAFHEGYAVVAIYKDGEPSRYVINKKGETVFNIKDRYDINSYDGIRVKDGLLPVYDAEKEKFGFLNLKGEFIAVPSKVDDILDFNNEVFVFEDEEGDCGVISLAKDNEQIIRSKYDDIVIISSTEFLVDYDADYYVLNDKDERIIDLSDYDDVVPCQISATQCYIAQEGRVSMLLDKEGKKIGDVEFYEERRYEYDDEACISSDYFDAQGVAKAVEDFLDTYVVGEPMSKYVKNPEECEANTRRYSVSDLDGEENGDKIDLVLYSDYPYIKNRAKSINGKAKLEEAELVLWTVGGCSVDSHMEKIDKQLAKILKSRGFAEDEDGLFVKDDVCVYREEEDGVYCIVMSKEGASKASSIGGWGKIANVKCRLDLDLASGKGTLSYNTAGSQPFILSVSEYYDYDGAKTYADLVVFEYDYNENYTGRFIGQYYADGGEYSGTYYRRDGKEFYFSFSLE